MSAVTEGEWTTTATTRPDSPDPSLRGRTYAISFDRVWKAACALAGGGMRRWRMLSADDQEGVIEAEATSLVLRVVDHAHITVGLDENAQTRIDMAVTTTMPSAGFGRGRRLVGRFYRRLDARIVAGPEQILDASRGPSWSA